MAIKKIDVFATGITMQQWNKEYRSLGNKIWPRNMFLGEQFSCVMEIMDGH